MGRLLLAVTLAFGSALARCESGAFQSLIAMADSASTDLGPNAGELPKDEPKPAPKPASDADSGPVVDGDAPLKDAVGSPAAEAPARAPAPAPRPETKPEAGPAVVAVPSAQAPRVWTRMFASLIPPMPRLEAKYEVATSTRPARAARPAEASRKATAASKFGSAMGLSELVATTAAASSPDR